MSESFNAGRFPQAENLPGQKNEVAELKQQVTLIKNKL